MTDPHAKRWLADDPKFLASLERSRSRRSRRARPSRGGVRRGCTLAASRHRRAPAAAGAPCRTDVNTARAMDPSRVLDTPLSAPFARSLPRAAGIRAPPALSGRGVRCSICFRRRRSCPSVRRTARSATPVRSAAAAAAAASRSRRRADRRRRRSTALTDETFYGLREKPFSLSTDPRFLYPERGVRTRQPGRARRDPASAAVRSC